ncbi:MAG: hypothetical protein OSA48_10990 [Akkermansiaceae bacterium]|nr:hypothetical protein [Akkermansiaceae bacterium]
MILEIYISSGIEAARAATEKIEDRRYRGFLQKAILSEMAKTGHAEKALEFVKEKVGLGKNRTRVVEEITSRSDLSVSAVLDF